MVINRVDYEQKRINEQITVAKHIWKVKANAHSSYILESVYRNNWLELLTFDCVATLLHVVNCILKKNTLNIIINILM